MKNKYEFNIFAKSIIGKRHENQDNYLIRKDNGNGVVAKILRNEKEITTIPINSFNQFIRIAVADGMGGHENGREVAEAIIEELRNGKPKTTPENLITEVKSIHKKLQAKFSIDSEKSPGSTLVVADINRSTGHCVLLNVGDSRAYIKNGNCYNQITYDHSLIEFAYRDQEIGIDEYKNASSHKNSLVQAMIYGSSGILKDRNGDKPYRYDPDIRLDLPKDLPDDRKDHADVISFYLKKDDILILATDGLFKDDPELSWQQLIDYNKIKDNDFIDRLVSNSSSTDNITAIVCSVS